MIELAGRILAIGFMILGAVCWFAGVFYMIRTHTSRKPGVPLFGNIFLRASFNFYDPSDLTPRGIDAQQKFWGCLAGFLICALLSIVVGTTLGGFEMSSGR